MTVIKISTMAMTAFALAFTTPLQATPLLLAKMVYLPSLGTVFAYLLVICIYAILGFMAITGLKRWGKVVCCMLFCLLSAQLIHWHNLDVAKQRHKAQLAERTAEIYTLLNNKFAQFDKNKDGKIDEKELGSFKTNCSCNAGTISFVRANLSDIGTIREVKNGDNLLTIDHADLEDLKERALEQLSQ